MPEGQFYAPEGQFTAISPGWTRACGLRTDNTIACWGKVNSAPDGQFTAISPGWTRACGLRTDGTVTCWGTPELVTAPGGVRWRRS